MADKNSEATQITAFNANGILRQHCEFSKKRKRELKTKLRGLSPLANTTDQATAACCRIPTFAD
jgi:hypothetical protein